MVMSGSDELEEGVLGYCQNGINLLAINRRLKEHESESEAFSGYMGKRKHFFHIEQFIIRMKDKVLFPRVGFGQREVRVFAEDGQMVFTMLLSNVPHEGFKPIFARYPFFAVYVRLVDQDNKQIPFGQLIYFP